MLSSRGLTICFSFILTYFAVWLGDAFHIATNDHPALWLLFGLIAVAMVMGATLFEEEYVSANKNEKTSIAAAVSIVGGFIFGAAKAPITYCGPWPFQWATPWSLIILLAVMPMAFAIKDFVIDILAERNKHPRGNITRLRG